MKCSKCGFENKDKAKFCTKCGSSLTQVNVETPAPIKSGNSKYIIIALIAVIILLVGCMAYFALGMGSSDSQDAADSQQSADSQQVDSVDNKDSDSDDEDVHTETISSTKSKSKSWELIGSYSGSGSGSQSISVPEGDIKVELSAYPIKNYATNHLYVTGSNGKSGGVDWGSTSAVETRSDSFTYSSSSSETFTIEYYETVSWEVYFYRYQ